MTELDEEERKNNMNTKFVRDYIDSKLSENDKYIVFSFFELRVKANLTEEETDEFLALCKNKLENMRFNVYFTGAKYPYQGETRTVQINELLVAIKDEG